MHHTNYADHARHDLALIAGHAAGDLSDTDRVHADDLIATCTPCTDLRRDLVAISAATRSLPAPAMPARDFRLHPEQAERLRRGSWLRGVLRPFAASGSAVRPMATAFTSLGLAGLLVITVIPSLFGPAAGAPAAAPDEAFEAARASAGVAAPAATQLVIVPQGAEPSNDRMGEVDSGPPVLVSAGGKSTGEPSSPPEAAIGGDASDETDAPRDLAIAATGPSVNPLLAGSLGLLLVGLLLFGLGIAGRRLR